MPEGLAAEEQLKPPVNLYRLAIVFEFLHGASLLHDDVLDHARTRRGKPSANTVWDNNHVILAGDFLHARALTLAGTIGGEQCLKIIGNATSSMIDAEFLQMQTVADMNLSEENYFSVLRGKTGSLISAACEVGTFFTETGQEQRDALRTYGNAIGLAFQVVDDLLDYQGDPDKTGKAVGNDFIEGKMTLPLIHALQNSEQSESDQILALLRGNQEERATEVANVCSFIDKNDGFSYARQGAETLVEAAVEALSLFPSCQARSNLEGLAHYILIRQK
jgi:octaprenyl-diphosphate synthase